MMNLQYHLPAEWEKQAATWLGWPHAREDWPGKFAPIPWVYCEIIRHITQVQRVRLCVKSKKEEAQARNILERAEVNLGKMDFYIIPTNRCWLRDSGPLFVKDAKDKKTLAHFRFNAWAKYPNHKLDARVPEHIESVLKYPRIQPMHKGKRVVLEGGSIDVNGNGVLLTTEECLLSEIQCRNPGFTREDYEEIFAKHLGISQIIWLGNGIVGDDTHGHVDDITRFTDATTIATVVERDKRDENYALLQENLQRLKRATDAKGKPFTIAELPMPKPLVFEGQRLPASYANFLICNDLVLVPTFNDPADRIALNTLQELFPKRTVVGIHAVDLVWGLGTLHCMSMQEPA